MTHPVTGVTHAPLEGCSTMRTKQKHREPSTEPYAVRVTLSGEPPEGVDPVRHVGPYENDLHAEEAAATFGRMADDMGRDDVHIEVVAFVSPVVHLDPSPPKDFEALAEQIGENPVRGPWQFPDLHDRLVAAHGRPKAEWAWKQALAYIACRGGAQKLITDARLDAYRQKVKAASDRLIEPFAPPILDDAARLLAALVDAASGYGVDRDLAAGQLAPFALDGVAARITTAA